MKTRLHTRLFITALLALAASGSIFAQQADKATPPPTKTRAQVLAELKEAQASGNDMPTGFIAYHAPATKESAPLPVKTADKN
ncbi:MAG TPA: DUF4148 domain-containing protein [Burkholderiaceae bacterium]